MFIKARSVELFQSDSWCGVCMLSKDQVIGNGLDAISLLEAGARVLS